MANLLERPSQNGASFNQKGVNYMSYIKMIINESKNDNKLFARYCFKFIEDIKNNNTWLINELNNESSLLNEFQIILLSGLASYIDLIKTYN